MGFNGCRKHQKAEDPRFLYWADKLGYIVWGEMAAACVYNETSVARTTREWIDIVERDYNHPCICVWVPLNEELGCAVYRARPAAAGPQYGHVLYAQEPRHHPSGHQQ